MALWVQSPIREVTETLPEGVSLQRIDGGSNYYANNGFTFAAAAGWDDPSFIPISLFLQDFRTAIASATAARWVDLGVNTSLDTDTNNGGPDLSVMRSNNINLIAQAQAGQLATVIANGGALGSETVGLNAFDEPSDYGDCIAALQSVANSNQDNRFWYENYLWAQIAGFGVNTPTTAMDDLLNDLIATPNATTRHLDLISADIYWMAGTPGVSEGDGHSFNSATMYDRSILSTDERRRGARYGDMLDCIRCGYDVYAPGFPVARWQATYPAPIGVFVEVGGPFTSDTTLADYITPPEINAAVWNTIIHGARHVQYFNHSFAGPAITVDCLGTAFYQSIQSPNTISIYDQVKNTNTLVHSLASVINSPFANGFVTVSPAGWNFSDGAPLTAFNGSGFDVMAKYHNVSGGDNKFYIFAMPRYSQATTNQSATFTIKNTGATAVTVINEARSITVTNNGTQFVDNFATGNTVHIYRVD